MSKLTIGKLAKEANVNVETVRFYEKKGLIKRPTLGSGPFRIYSDEAISKINFIKKAQEIGFTLREIKEFISFEQNTIAPCSDVATKAQAKLTEVNNKILSLKKMQKALKKLISSCEVNPEKIGNCKVSDCFDNKCP